MSNEITMNALVAKRAEILFEIGEAEKRIAQLQIEIVHLDAVLRMFRPEFKAEGLPVRHRRPTKSPYFTHGELTQRIFDALRIGGTVMSFEIAAQAMRDKGLDPENDKPNLDRFRPPGGAGARRHAAQGQDRKDWKRTSASVEARLAASQQAAVAEFGPRFRRIDLRQGRLQGRQPGRRG